MDFLYEARDPDTTQVVTPDGVVRLLEDGVVAVEARARPFFDSLSHHWRFIGIRDAPTEETPPEGEEPAADSSKLKQKTSGK